jgi:5-methylcytosine-specific restriction endonuclease McrA
MAFSYEVIAAAWERSGGRCECERKTCGHIGRCNEPLELVARGFDNVPGGWEAHHKVAVASGGTDTLSNCEILCIPCHKNTRTYGR